jgi:hypothetical protein
VFFDTHEIADMDDWRQKIQRSLHDSQVFLAVLSPQGFALGMGGFRSNEAMRQYLCEGVAPGFFVTRKVKMLERTNPQSLVSPSNG